MKYNIPGKVLSDISLFAKNHSAKKVILFGSRARGTNTERSDIDIAVLGGDFDGFFWDIKENTRTLLMFDVIDLNSNISDELKEIIEKEGVVIYEEA
ncbi:MAG: nucleotidyltransferase domain-containing protein [Clostridiales bacterium]|nr:nucleotidyltransferase domain-containing protein [Clostridiales bacterium]